MQNKQRGFGNVVLCAREIVGGLEGAIDLVFIDAAKPDYIAYFDDLASKLGCGGCIIADNMIFPERPREEVKACQPHVRARPPPDQ